MVSELQLRVQIQASLRQACCKAACHERTTHWSIICRPCRCIMNKSFLPRLGLQAHVTNCDLDWAWPLQRSVPLVAPLPTPGTHGQRGRSSHQQKYGSKARAARKKHMCCIKCEACRHTGKIDLLAHCAFTSVNICSQTYVGGAINEALNT